MAEPGVIAYTARDYDAIMEALKAHLQSKFPVTWKDLYEDATGVQWIELVAYTYSILSYYLDITANNAYLSSAVDRDAVTRICKLVGYHLQAPAAASVQVSLAIEVIQAADVVIAAGTQVTSTGGLLFEFLTEARVLAGDATGSASITQGRTRIDSFVSDGSAYQRFLLTATPVIEGSISVEVNGTEWTQMDSLVYGDATSTIWAVVYDVDEDGNDIAYVEFGDGTSGAIPPVGATINVEYRTGGGIQGNIGLNQISEQVNGTLDGAVPPVTIQVTVTNPTYRGSGGEDRETIEHAKYWAPQWVRTNGRAVTEADFDVLATRFVDATYGSVAYAKARLQQEIPELNTVLLAVWALDEQGQPTTASTGLKAALQAYFDENESGAVRLICVDTEVEDGINLYLDVTLTLASLSNYAEADVVQNTRSDIQDLFSSTSILPGKAFRIADLYHTIKEADGVDYGIVNSIKAGLRQTLSLGTGNGVQTTFGGTLVTTPVLESTVVIDANGQRVTDDGLGVLTGDGTGTVDYDTGVVSVTWTTAPAAGESVLCTARYLVQYQRGGVESTVAATASRFRGSLASPPVVPGSFALSDGAQVVVDDGSGNLTGDVNPAGNNTFDYDTGSYDVTFASPVILGLTLSSTYRQYLNVSSGDIPVEKSQLAVLGNLTVTTV